jgi:hypothetical protein
MDTTIKHRGLTGTLYKVGKSPFWQLQFRHPSSLTRQRLSLSTEDIAMARAKAKAILDQTATAGLTALKDFTRKTSSESIGAACDHYLQASKVDSRKDNVNALLVVLRDSLGVDRPRQAPGASPHPTQPEAGLGLPAQDEAGAGFAEDEPGDGARGVLSGE